MKLYLSSYRLGKRSPELQRLLPAGGRMAVICNALDNAESHARARIVEREREDMKYLGFDSQELDLREWFGPREGLARALTRFHGLWVSGGNAFLLRRALHQSGLDAALLELVPAGRLVYAGYSAGAIMATPTLRGIELVDMPHDVPPGYEPRIIEDCLGFTDFSIAPHYRSDHPESEAIEEVVAYFETHTMPYRALRDGEVIVVDQPPESGVVST